MKDMNNVKKEFEKTAKKAKYMVEEVAEDLKEDFQGAKVVMENKKDELVDRYEQKKFAHEIKQKMEKEMK
ncbi:MAG: hypothetical protein ACRDA3_14310 [Peptostreptococcaceae bacterium]